MAGSLRLHVDYSDGRGVDVRVSPRAYVMFERQYQRIVTGELGAESIYYLAWASLHAAGQEARTFDEFVDALADAELAGEEAADPTPPSQSTAD